MGGSCWSSERSGEDAGAPLIFSPCRGHRCSQTSGLTLITHIHRQGGGGGRGKEGHAAPPESQTTPHPPTTPPSYPSSPLSSPLCFYSSLSTTFAAFFKSHPKMIFFFLLILHIAFNAILDTEMASDHRWQKKKKRKRSKKSRVQSAKGRRPLEPFP